MARYCGAKKKQGKGKCRRPAGWGTPNKTGRCKLHGGATPSHKRKAAKEAAAEAVATYGLPREVDPLQALLEEVWRTAGHVAWLERVIRGLDADHLVHGVTKTTRTEPLAGEGAASGTKSGKGRKSKGTEAKPDPGTERIEQAAAVNVWVRLYQSERAHLTKVAKAAVDAGIEERLVHLAEEQAQLVAEFGRGLLKAFGIDPSSEKARKAFRTQLSVIQGGRKDAA